MTNANVAIVNGFTQACLVFVARDGKQFVDLTGGSNALAGIQQTVATTPGASYLLTFYVGAINGSVFGPLSTVDAYVNGQLLTSALNFARAGNPLQTWQKATATFRANSARTTILFMNGDPPGVGGDNGLDAVSLDVVR